MLDVLKSWRDNFSIAVIQGRAIPLESFAAMTTNRCLLRNLALPIIAVWAAAQPQLVAQSGASGAPASSTTQDVDLNAIAVHSHSPVTVRSRPVIERLPLHVIEPIDLQVSRTASVFVADAQANCIFRLDQLGTTSLPARQLNGLRRIIVDADETIYALTTSSNNSTIHQITPEGRQIVLHTLPVAADCFSRVGIDGWMAAFGNSVWHIAVDSAPQQIARFPLPVVDLCTNVGGGTNVLLGDGRVLQLGIDGASRSVGRAPHSARRLFCQPNGQLAVLAESSDNHALAAAAMPLGLYQVAANAPEANPIPSARLPEGTSAVGFDSLGNLCLANPQLRAITRVTSRFQIPCPHCGQLIPLIFDARLQPENVGGF